ncbi:MAG TPA: exodeoxyribonuclease V subunit alpha [Polyangiaceae bacterium]|nr:exodeoxyribonuclease V subunit alpha [Polyangiaceae bacterium]
MSTLSPDGTARARFLGERATSRDERLFEGVDVDDFEATYLGWEIARCAPGLAPGERRAIALLAAASVIAVRGGSTRLPLDDVRLASALAPLHGVDALPVVRSILQRARAATPADPVVTVLGHAGERKPLVLDGDWLYLERMCGLEERFCARMRARLAHPVPARGARSLGRVLAAIAAGPPALTEEQKRAVREALGARLALVTGGPGTGKTTIVVALLRALAWIGEPMSGVAIAAPTGKAAQRLRDAIGAGLASPSSDIAESTLRTTAPVPQTLHRLLGWSPGSGRFARHENDRLPHRVVIVDEASMVDLTIMDRLMRALAEDARLVLLGDADQLPSVEAGAVFRDLCAALPAVRLSTNLRVGRDSIGRRIVAAAQSVNGGQIDARFEESVSTRRAVGDLTFEGVEHLAAPWSEVGEELLERWWRSRVASLDEFAGRVARTYRLKAGSFDPADRAHLDALLDHQARSRLLCATRLRGMTTSAEALNEQLLEKLRGTAPQGWRRRRSTPLGPGAPVMVERNDYERQLFNGDQGIVVRVDSGGLGGPELMAVFRQGSAFQAFPVDALTPLAPSWAMTVHKAQGSEFDDVVVVLPDVDLPLLTRELLYTAMTRARRSVLFVGTQDLLARAVSRAIDRHSGIAEKLAHLHR